MCFIWKQVMEFINVPSEENVLHMEASNVFITKYNLARLHKNQNLLA